MNEKTQKIFEWKGYVICAASFLFTFWLFYSYTAEPFYCFIASLITAGIIWGSYLIMRIMLITMRS